MLVKEIGMLERTIKILFVYTDLSSFVKTDLDILKHHFDVEPVQWTRTRDVKNMLRIAWHLLRADLSFTWFAGGHAARVVFLSKLFGKKSIVIVGGYEVADVPEIGYGAMIDPKSARKVKYVLENADLVLTVDDSLKRDAINNARVDGKNIITVPTGYGSDKWESDWKKEDLVITVGYVDDLVVKRKGFETFVKAAKYLPNAKFVLIGAHVDNSVDYLKSIAPQNVEFTGFAADEILLKWYQRAKVYCQLSRYEGLPNALCEAMLCECAPVGTKYCGIPTAIGDTGFYTPYGDPKATAEAIEKALKSKSDKGKDARGRIKRMFPIERRSGELVRVINGILGEH